MDSRKSSEVREKGDSGLTNLPSNERLKKLHLWILAKKGVIDSGLIKLRKANLKIKGFSFQVGKTVRIRWVEVDSKQICSTVKAHVLILINQWKNFTDKGINQP